MRLWNGKSMLLGCVVVAIGWTAGNTGETAAPWEEHGKLRVSADGHHLEHADGTPMLWIADTGWALFYKLRREDVIEYLDQRSRQSFNVIQAVAYWYPHGEDGPGPTNAANQYGHSPFEGGADEPDTARARVVDGGSPDAPNDYWDNADFIVRETRRRGLYLAMLPCWGRAYINPQWWTLSPQPALIQGAPGEGSSQIVAVRSSGANRILVYLPVSCSVKVKLDMAGSKATARWFDPRDSREISAGEHDCGSTVDFAPPAGWEDAVLIVATE